MLGNQEANFEIYPILYTVWPDDDQPGAFYCDPEFAKQFGYKAGEILNLVDSDLLEAMMGQLKPVCGGCFDDWTKLKNAKIRP